MVFLIKSVYNFLKLNKQKYNLENNLYHASIVFYIIDIIKDYTTYRRCRVSLEILKKK